MHISVKINIYWLSINGIKNNIKRALFNIIIKKKKLPADIFKYIFFMKTVKVLGDESKSRLI